MDRYELAWAAGFFDGEGWANAVRQKGRSTAQPHAQINQAGSDGIPAVLVRLQKAVGGLGHVGGPYVLRGRKDLYRWIVSSRDDVELLHHFLLPWLGEVKLRAFASALGRRPALSRQDLRPSDEWLAWTAGLFDGEGCASLHPHRTHVGRVIGEVALTQCSDDGGEPEVLRRLLEVVGRGHINGPYVQRGAGRDVYRWKVQAQSEIEPSLMALWPWLGPVKRDQASRVMSAIRGQSPLERGNPEWGNRKMFCVNGHEYATARVRRFVARNGGEEPRASSACLQCMREYAKRRREEKKRSAAHDGRRSLSEQEVTYAYLLK